MCDEQEIKEIKTSVLDNKNFLLLFIGSIVSRLGDVIFNFAMGWYILAITGSQLMSSLFVAIGLITMTLFQIFGGVIADKFNKVRLVYLMDFLSGSTLILCFIANLFSSEMSHLFQINHTTMIIIILYITSFLLNLFSAFFRPASASLIPKIVDEKQYQQAQSLSNFSMNINNILGLVLGPVLLFLFNANAVILINGITFILSGISELFIKVKDEEEKGNAKFKTMFKSFRKDIVEGIRYIKNEVGIIQLIVLAILINFFLSPMFMIFPQYLFNQVLKTPSIYYGITEGIFSAAALVCSVILAVRKQPDKVYGYIRGGLVINSFVTFLMLGLFYTILENYIPFYLFMILYGLIMVSVGFLITIVNVPLNVAFMKKIDKNMFGRVIAIFGTFVGLVTPLSLILFGWLIDNIGLIYSLITAVCGGLVGVTYLVLNKKLKEI